jgi:hypothetical protein
MKRALSIVLQVILFLAVSFLGIILAGINVLPTLSVSIGPSRVFVYDGLLLMLAAYVFILLVEVLLKRLRIAWLNSTIAAVLALILGLAMKFGFKTV